MRKASKQDPLRQYNWGDRCTGWELADEDALSFKQESMPPGTAEQMHYHERALQVFHIIEATATFETPEGTVIVNAGESLTIPPGTRHRICNQGNVGLEFILASAPSTKQDRINISEHE